MHAHHRRPAVTNSTTLRFDRPVDLPQLLKRCLGNEQLAEQILVSFHERFEAEVAQLENALLQRDGQKLAALAHRLKGAAASVSADRLSHAAAGIEREAQARRFDLASSWIARFITEGRSLSRYVNGAKGFRTGAGV